MLQHEYVRHRLTEALLSHQKKSCNQIVAMAEKSQTGCKFQAKAIRKIAVGINEIIVEADPVRCSSSRSYKTSSIPVTTNIFSHIAWRRAVKLMAPHHQAWINYCYGDSTSFDHQQQITLYVWAIFQINQKKTSARSMSKKTYSVVRSLTWLAVQESKHITNRGDRKYRSKELCELADVSPQNWNINYQPRWDSLLRACEQLDSEALSHAEFLQKKTKGHFR